MKWVKAIIYLLPSLVDLYRNLKYSKRKIMNASVLTLIGSIVLEGVKLWSEERRTRFLDEYHDLITKLNQAESDYSAWSDFEVSRLTKDLELFLQAYKTEIQKGAE
jgi:hypothetical protein